MSARGIRRILAGNIRKAAKQRGVALNVVADLAGVSRSQLFDVLASRKSPTVDWLCRVADALETNASDLLREP